MLFNRQIMKYLGSNALAVYGPVINVSTIVQCCAYSVGQAAQPIISINFGAKKWQRIKETLWYALYTVGAFSIFWTAFSLICPNLYIYIFMKPTKAILEIAPAIIRCYSISFLSVVAGADSIWFAMPITELLVSVYAVFMMNKYTKELSKEVAL